MMDLAVKAVNLMQLSIAVPIDTPGSSHLTGGSATTRTIKHTVAC